MRGRADPRRESANGDSRVDGHPASKSRLIRDLALRGAEATEEERGRREAARDFFLKVADGEIELDLDAAREVHEEREGDIG